MPRVKDPERHEAQKQRIMTVAINLISSKGYAATTMDDVASAVDMTKAALYYYFSTKADLLLEICENVVETSVRDLETIATAAGLDAPARLRQVVLLSLRAMESHREAFTVFYQDFWRVNHPRAQAVRRKQREYDRRIQEIVQDGIDDGSIRPIPVTLGALALVGMCSWSYRWLAEEGRSSEDVGQVFADILLNGLAEPTA
jgi:AcrR family transcriptional regulator